MIQLVSVDDKRSFHVRLKDHCRRTTKSYYDVLIFHSELHDSQNGGLLSTDDRRFFFFFFPIVSAKLQKSLFDNGQITFASGVSYLSISIDILYF